MINLLPWREKRRQQQAIKIMIHWLCLTIFVVILGALFYSWQQKIDHQIYQQKQHIRKLKSQFSAGEAKLKSLRQHTVKGKFYPVLNSENIDIILNTLPFIPIQQGELQKVLFNAEKISIQGVALSQQEFAAIEQFVMQHPQFSQQKLKAFNPTTKDIYFEFSLHFKGE